MFLISPEKIRLRLEVEYVRDALIGGSVSLEGVHERVSLDGPVFDQASISSNKKVLLIYLEQVSGSSLVLESFDNVLSTGLQVNYSEQDLRLVII